MNPFENPDGVPTSAGVRVLPVNDFELILRGLDAMLRPFRDRVEVLGPDGLADPTTTTDVALVDCYGQHQLGLGRIAGLVASPRLGAAILYTTYLQPAQVDRVLAAGAAAVVSKAVDAEQLVASIEAVAAGRRGLVVPSRRRRRTAGPWPGSELGLSERESEISVFLCAGLGNRGIAESMFLSENTVKSHLKSVFHKISASTRSQAVARLVMNPSFRRYDTADAVAAMEPAAAMAD